MCVMLQATELMCRVNNSWTPRCSLKTGSRNSVFGFFPMLTRSHCLSSALVQYLCGQISHLSCPSRNPSLTARAEGGSCSLTVERRFGLHFLWSWGLIGGLPRCRAVAKRRLQSVGEMQSVVKKKKFFFLKTLALDSQVKVLFLKDGAAEAGGGRAR